MTSTEFTRNSDNFCYRHPDRQSFVLCQRCLRTVCPECQIAAPVGVICPQCLRDQQKARSDVQRRAERRWGGRATAATAGPLRGTPVVTYWIIGITVGVFLTQLIPNSPVQALLQYNSVYLIPQLGHFQPWRLVTMLLVHESWMHIGLNMLALWMIGRIVEPLVGHVRLLVMYVISGIGGSVAVALLAPGTSVIGASGAIFGLFGALFIIGRHIGANITGIAVVIGINFAFPFILGLLQGSMAGVQISWQAHLGGLIAGCAAAFILVRTRAARQRTVQAWLLGALTVAILALLIIPATLYV